LYFPETAVADEYIRKKKDTNNGFFSAFFNTRKVFENTFLL
jgi:hypothetical protein